MTEKRDLLYAFYKDRMLQYNEKSIVNLKTEIFNSHFPFDVKFESHINQLFQDAIDKKINFDLFFASLRNEPLVLFVAMNENEKLIPEKTYKEKLNPHITSTDLTAIQHYIQNKKLSVSFSLGSAKEKILTPTYPENQFNFPFAIHSIGKVFTGVLVLMMIEQDVLNEDDLNRPVQLDQTVLKKLPGTVREQLKNVTLYQLMIHQGGLGDYLDHYFDAIKSGHPPIIRRAEDFLPFVDAEVYPIGVERYSNAGLLLVGLAIKHAYEKKYHYPIDYDVLLKNMLINTVGMLSFSIVKPDNAKYNLQDPIAPFIAGSPAGGYWLTSSDLAKFGQWLYMKSHNDARFYALLKKYGQEFYIASEDTVAHGGGIPSSSAFFSVSLRTGAVLVVESNQPPGYGDDLKMMVQRYVFAKPETV